MIFIGFLPLGMIQIGLFRAISAGSFPPSRQPYRYRSLQGPDMIGVHQPANRAEYESPGRSEPESECSSLMMISSRADVNERIIEHDDRHSARSVMNQYA